MRRLCARRKGAGEGGQTLVEFALVLPLLLLLVFGIFEFGRAWMVMNTVTSAAREGARVAVVTDPDNAAVQAAVQQVMTGANLSGQTVNIQGPNANNEVSVTVQYTYASMFAGFIPGLPNSFAITRTSTMRFEG